MHNDGVMKKIKKKIKSPQQSRSIGARGRNFKFSIKQQVGKEKRNGCSSRHHEELHLVSSSSGFLFNMLKNRQDDYSLNLRLWNCSFDTLVGYGCHPFVLSLLQILPIIQNFTASSKQPIYSWMHHPSKPQWES